MKRPKEIHIQYPPKKLSLEEQQLFVLEKIEGLGLTIETIKKDIRHGDIENKRRKREEYSLWRDRAKKAISTYKLKRQRYRNLFNSISRQMKIAQSTPLDEAKCFVAAAYEILDPEVFNRIRNVAQNKKNLKFEKTEKALPLNLDMKG